MLPTLLALALLAASACAGPRPVEVVAAVLVAEAGGERDAVRSMRAVREVIQTRAGQQRRSEVAVVTARLQFSCLNGTTPAQLVARARQHPRWPAALELARAPVPVASVGQADHYHALTVRPVWASGQRPVAVVGNHAFFRLHP